MPLGKRTDYGDAKFAGVASGTFFSDADTPLQASTHPMGQRDAARARPARGRALACVRPAAIVGIWISRELRLLQLQWAAVATATTALGNA
jgi:hypothetical protein